MWITYKGTYNTCGVDVKKVGIRCDFNVLEQRLSIYNDSKTFKEKDPDCGKYLITMCVLTKRIPDWHVNRDLGTYWKKIWNQRKMSYLSKIII